MVTDHLLDVWRRGRCTEGQPVRLFVGQLCTRNQVTFSGIVIQVLGPPPGLLALGLMARQCDDLLEFGQPSDGVMCVASPDGVVIVAGTDIYEATLAAGVESPLDILKRVPHHQHLGGRQTPGLANGLDLA